MIAISKCARSRFGAAARRDAALGITHFARSGREPHNGAFLSDS